MLDLAGYLKHIIIRTAALFKRPGKCEGYERQVILLAKEKAESFSSCLQPWYAFNRCGIETHDQQGNPIYFYGVGFQGRVRNFFWSEVVLPELENSLENLLLQVDELRGQNPTITYKARESFVEIIRAWIREALFEARQIDLLLRHSNQGAKPKPYNTEDIEETLTLKVRSRIL